MSSGVPLTEEQVLFVRKNFSDMTNQALADAIGVSKSAVSSIQARYHLTKSPGHVNAMAVKAGKASNVARGGKTLNLTPEVIARRVASYRKTFREEQVRRRWGLKQRTKMKVLRQPKQKVSQRSYLKSLGYIIDEPNCTAYYTEDTIRAVRMEKDWSKNVHQYYRFKPLSKSEEQ